MTKDVLKYVRQNILGLAPYSTARDEYSGGEISVWLDANENPYDNGVNRYPDPHQRLLKQRLSEIKGIGVEHIFVGNGSDEAIDLVFRIFARPGTDNAVSIAPSYGMYSVAAETNDIEFRQVQLESDFSLPSQRLLDACDSHTKLLFLCSPNNPTGLAFPLSEIEALCDRADCIVVLDEAYVDFSEKGSMLGRLSEHPNLIILQTLSKAWGMAGLRLGLAFADPQIATLLGRVKYPYNVNGPTQKEVLRRLEVAPLEQIEEIKSQRELLWKRLPEMRCIERVYKSDANFFLVKATTDATELYDYLVSRGMIVRNRSRIKGLEGCLRITIGTPAENEKLLSLLSDYPLS